MYLLEVRGGQGLDHTGALAEAGAEDAVGVLEHAVFQRHDDELRTLEPGFDEAADILRVRQI